MNDIFQDLITEGVVCVYLDDILIFTETMEEHDRVTRLVLERLRQYKLYLRHDKSSLQGPRSNTWPHHLAWTGEMDR